MQRPGGHRETRGANSLLLAQFTPEPGSAQPSSRVETLNGIRLTRVSTEGTFASGMPLSGGIPFFADRTTGLSKQVLNYSEYGFEFDYLHIGFKG